MFRKIWSYFGHNKKYAVIATAFVILETILELMIPMVMVELVDIGIKNKDVDFILQKGIVMLLLAVLSLGAGLLYARFAALAGQGLGANVREMLYKKMQQFSFFNMDNFTESSLVTRITSDVTVIQGTVGQGIRPLARGPVMAVVSCILALRLNASIAFIFLISAPILGITVYFVIRATKPWYQKTQKMLDNINLKVQETLLAIRVVKSYVTGKSEECNFAKITKEYQEVSQQAFHFSVMNAPLLQISMYATTVALLWVGGGMIPDRLQVGELMACLSYVLQILNGLMMFSFVFTMLMRAIVSIERVEEVLNEEIDMKETSFDTHKIQKGEIRFENVSFKYNQKASENVLTNIDLHIEAGETVGIVGGTGAAKSSLVQLIPRLYDVSAGCIQIDGVDVKDYTLKNLREQIGIVLQKSLLFSGTIRENLQWGDSFANDSALDKVCEIACIDEFIKQLPKGYDTELGQGGVNLSGGQKQRLCIARTLLKRPQILIFDDTTSAVDTATELTIRTRMEHELQGITKLIISQRVSSVMHAQKILVLRDGKIDAIGKHEELVEYNEIYRNMYETQKKGAIL